MPSRTSAEMLEDGYLPVGIRINGDAEYTIPPYGETLSLLRPNWPNAFVGRMSHLRQEANINGLWWKRTGIGKETGR